MSRAVEIAGATLGLFDAERTTLGVAELADTIKTSRSTAHRFLTSLMTHGYLEQDPARRYRLAPGAANAAIAAIETVRAQMPGARAVLEELRDQSRLTVSLGALDGIRVVFLERLFSHRAGQYQADLDLRVGAQVPVYCTAIGKALLADVSQAHEREILDDVDFVGHGPKTITSESKLRKELVRIRARGFATCDEEQAAGVRSIAATVGGRGRLPPIAVGVTAPASRYTSRELAELSSLVVAAAKRI